MAENDVVMEEKKPMSPLAQVKTTGAGAPSLANKTSSMISGSLDSLDSNRSEKKAILDKAITNLEKRMSTQSQGGPSAEELFRISAAFGAPTKTGGFSESIANAGTAGADILKGRRESSNQLEDMMMKYKLQGLDVDSDYLKQALQVHKELGGSQSNYGKIAQDEGLAPGTPEFANRVKQLSQVDIDAKVAKSKGSAISEGEFDRKTGNFLTPGGTVIPKTEVSKDREARQKLLDQKASFAKIDKKTISQAISPFDYTGAGATGSLGKAFAGTFKEDKLNAQTKIVAQAIEGIQKALPPGPASDKDVAQAKATFPGFSSKKALSEWLKSLDEMVDRHLATQDNKYGSDKWFGASGAPKSASKAEGNNRNDLGETPTEQKNMQKGNVPKKGAVLNGYRFKGGDPSVEANWEPV